MDRVSQSGDVLAKYSGRQPSLTQSTDEIDIVNFDGAILERFRPDVLGLTAFFAELSPDGQRIAFVGAFENPKPYGLHLVTNIGEIRVLVSLPERELPRSIGWSKDGNQIVYDSREQIFIYDLATGLSRPLVSGSAPTWSPDSRYLLFTNAGTGEISVLDLQDGRRERVILPIDGRNESGLRWVRGFPDSVGPWPRQ